MTGFMTGSNSWSSLIQFNADECGHNAECYRFEQFTADDSRSQTFFAEIS
jgi:hypothetical protein